MKKNRKKVEIELAVADIPGNPETPFEKGIVLTIDWYLANPEWMDHVTSGDYQKYYEQMYKNK